MNLNICPICLGHPGVLPAVNREVVMKALTFGKKINAEISTRSSFARKNYFYPDLPKGYQISQYDSPPMRGGSLIYFAGDDERKGEFQRTHLEEDTAKIYHLPDGTARLDFNRAGIPLMEIVTKPIFHSGQEVTDFLEELRQVLILLGVSDGNMEEGNFRCEPNISVRKIGEERLGTRCEVKNLNSYSILRKAVDAEVKRQIAIIEGGGEVKQQTMRWDDNKGETVPMRKKETEADYRYFDEPDLPVLVITDEMLALAKLKVDEIESPSEKRMRIVSNYALSAYDARMISSSQHLTDLFDDLVKRGHSPKTVANWLLGEVLRLEKENQKLVTADIISSVLKLLEDRKINNTQAKDVLETAFSTGKSPEEIVSSSQMGRMEDALLLEIVRRVIEGNPRMVEDFKKGKVQVLRALVGQVMKETKGSADAEKAKSLIESELRKT